MFAGSDCLVRLKESSLGCSGCSSRSLKLTSWEDSTKWLAITHTGMREAKREARGNGCLQA